VICGQLLTPLGVGEPQLGQFNPYFARFNVFTTSAPPPDDACEWSQKLLLVSFFFWLRDPN
jgi:hypothetical protein